MNILETMTERLVSRTGVNGGLRLDARSDLFDQFLDERNHGLEKSPEPPVPEHDEARMPAVDVRPPVLAQKPQHANAPPLAEPEKPVALDTIKSATSQFAMSNDHQQLSEASGGLAINSNTRLQYGALAINSTLAALRYAPLEQRWSRTAAAAVADGDGTAILVRDANLLPDKVLSQAPLIRAALSSAGISLSRLVLNGQTIFVTAN